MLTHKKIRPLRYASKINKILNLRDPLLTSFLIPRLVYFKCSYRRNLSQLAYHYFLLENVPCSAFLMLCKNMEFFALRSMLNLVVQWWKAQNFEKSKNHLVKDNLAVRLKYLHIFIISSFYENSVFADFARSITSSSNSTDARADEFKY